jgi:hypothetical protein
MTKFAHSLAALCLTLAFGLPGASAQSLGPTLQKIKDSGVITIAPIR